MEYLDLLHMILNFTRIQLVVMWQSMLIEGEKYDVECVQKVSLRLILKEQYFGYISALKLINLKTLEYKFCQKVYQERKNPGYVFTSRN